jgi:hypothetical protein
MKFQNIAILIALLFVLAACSSAPQLLTDPVSPEPTGQYPYKVGLGYGFLGKQVQVNVDGREVLSVVGTEEIEQFAQLLGTKMLGGGSTDTQLVTVQVVVDGEAPFEAAIDLADGGFIHVYFQESGLQVFNTSVLILE